MLFLTALSACLGTPSDCDGDDPIPLYGSQSWEGPPGVVSLVTWQGPGRVCEVTCDQPWVHPGYIWQHEPCHEGRLELELEAGEWAGMCAFIDPDASGEATCTVSLPSGPVDFQLSIEAGDGDGDATGEDPDTGA